MIIAEILSFFIFLIITYSILFFEKLGYQIITFGPAHEPHWLLQWITMIWIAIAMTFSMIFLIKRSSRFLINFIVPSNINKRKN